MLRLIFLLLTAAFFAPTARAVTYPWIDTGTEGAPTSQVIFLPNPRVDYALRVAALHRARYSVDLATYVQGLDERVGMPLIEGMRAAASKGLSVRAIFDRLGSTAFDPLNRAETLLTDAMLTRPADVISFDLMRKLHRGINLTDKLHWKVLHIDAGTPHEILFIGGRNNNDKDLEHLDFAMVIRPFGNGPHVGEQVKSAYDELFKSLSDAFPVSRGRSSAPLMPESDDEGLTMGPSTLEGDADVAQFLELNTLLRHLPDPTSAPHALEARPRRMRLLTNDLLQQALGREHGNTFRSRAAGVTSDILSAAVDAVNRSERGALLASMIVAIPEPLKEALINLVARGVPFTGLSNSREAMTMYVPTGFTYYLSLQDLRDLLVAGINAEVYLLDPQREPGTRFTHLKTLIADDTTFLGTENFNMTSYFRNGELALEIADAAFTAKFRQFVSQSQEQYFHPLTCTTALEHESGNNIVKRMLNRLLLSVY